MWAKLFFCSTISFDLQALLTTFKEGERLHQIGYGLWLERRWRCCMYCTVYSSVFTISAAGKVFRKHHLSTFRPMSSLAAQGYLNVGIKWVWAVWATLCLCKVVGIICSRQLPKKYCVCLCVYTTHLSCQHFVKQNSICPPVYRASIWLICNDLWRKEKKKLRSSALLKQPVSIMSNMFEIH